MWDEWILMKNDEDHVDISRESINYNKHGQWELKKAMSDTPQPAPASPEKFKMHSDKLNGMFADMYKASFAGEDATHHVNKIKDYVKKAPKGEIDIGHLGKLVEKQPYKRNINSTITNPYNRRSPLRHKDLGEMITPHIEDINSLTDIHKNHGGEAALRTVLRINGTNGVADAQYHDIGFKNPKMHKDLINSMWPGKGDDLRDYDHEPNPALGERYTSKPHNIPGKTEHMDTPHNRHLHEKVLDTWNAAQDWEADDHDAKQLAHEDAAVDRAYDQIKRHHNLK